MSGLSVGRMRWLDFWIGIPLCAVASALDRRPSVGAQRTPPRRVLFIGLAEMGSVVLAEPAMRQAAAGAELYFLGFGDSCASLALTGAIPPARAFRLRTDSLRHLAADSLRFMRWARAQAIDTVIDLEPVSRLSALLARGSGARRRAGFCHQAGAATYRGRLYSHPVTYDGGRHIAANFLALAATVGVAGCRIVEPALPPPEPVSTRAEAAVRQRLARSCPTLTAETRLVLLSPGGGAAIPQRRWPLPRYAALAVELLAVAPDVVVAVLGGPGETALADELVARVGDERCASIAGAFALEELPALFQCAVLMIGNDSGPAHFAARAALPSIVLFGPESPQRYRPLGPVTVLDAGLPCAPCIHPAGQRRSACRDNQCLQAITVAQVLAEARRLLAASGDAGRPPRRAQADETERE